MTEHLLNEITQLAKQIKANELPAFTDREKQAAITIATLEKAIIDLIQEGMAVKLIILSLFYFWIILEAPTRGVSQKEIDNWSLSLPEAMGDIIQLIRTIVNGLPMHQPMPELKQLGSKLNLIKSFIPPESFDWELSHQELVKQTTRVNTCIHTTTSDLLTQSFHPEIVANVLFADWLRLSTIPSYVSEDYYPTFISPLSKF